jgi:hypothetical protein
LKKGSPIATAVQILEAFNALPVAEVDQIGTGLFFEQTAEPGGAEAGTMREFLKAVVRVVVANKASSPLYSWMQLADGHVCRSLKATPCMKQGIRKPGVHQPWFVRCRGELGKELFESVHVVLAEPTAGVSRMGSLQEWPGGRVNGIALHSPATEDRNPHGEIGRLLD